MKSLVKLFIIVITSGLLFSCRSTNEDSSSSDWKALDSYHNVLAEVFHPLKDSGNVEPARRLLPLLREKGDSLALASLPGKVNNLEMKSLINKITLDTRSLADDIKSGASDSVIALKLNPIHDQFHRIHHLWNSGKEHENHHKD